MRYFECTKCDEVPCIILVPDETENDLDQKCLFKNGGKAEFVEKAERTEE